MAKTKSTSGMNTLKPNSPEETEMMDHRQMAPEVDAQQILPINLSAIMPPKPKKKKAAKPPKAEWTATMIAPSTSNAMLT